MRSQEREPHLVRAGEGKIHMDMSEEPVCVEIYRKNAGPGFRGPHLVWKFTGKMPDTDSGDGILCGNLQEKKPHGECTRAILCRNLEEKCRPRPCPPRSNTKPLSLTVRTPSVWPHCLGHYIFVFNQAIHSGIYRSGKKLIIYSFSIRQFIREYIDLGKK